MPPRADKLASMLFSGRGRNGTARLSGPAVRAIALGAALCAGSAPTPAQPAPSTLVFAAASTMVPLNDLAQSFEREQRLTVRFSFAASSTLARQVAHGARADLFLSANRQWLDRLERDGFLAADSRRELTGNRLALIRPADGGADVILGRPASLLGALAGYSGGPVDQAVMRATEVMMSIPVLLMVMLFVSLLGPSLASVTLVIGLLGWSSTCRTNISPKKVGSTERGLCWRLFVLTQSQT